MADHFSHEILEEKEKFLLQVEPFDPEPIITAVNKRYNEDNKTFDHLQTMIMFGLLKCFGGNKTWASIYKRTIVSSRKKLQDAVEFLSVKLGRQSGRDTLTVPRLMQSFPKLTWDLHCRLVRDGNYMKKAEIAIYHASMPMCLRYTGSPGVMGPDVWNAYRNEYCSSLLELGRLWKSEQTWEDITRFAVMNYERSAIKPDERITMEMVNEAEARIKAEKYVREEAALEAMGAKMEKAMGEWMEQNYYFNDYYENIMLSGGIQSAEEKEAAEKDREAAWAKVQKVMDEADLQSRRRLF